MELDQYIERKSGRRPSRTNPLVRNLAVRCGVSVDTIQSIAIRRRFASLALAEKIERATQHIVAAKHMTKPKGQRSE